MTKTILLFIFFASQSLANVGGSDMQNFNPSTSGLGFITVHPSQTLQPGQFNFGSFVTYATNSLAYSTVSTAPNNQTFTEPNDQLLYSDLHFGVGLTTGWELGLSAGFINSQSIQESNFLFSYGDTGINDFRLHSKVRVYNQNDFALAFVASVDFDQIQNNPFVGDNAGPTFNFEGVADYKVSSDLLWAINFGYRLRQAGTAIPNTGVIPISDQLTYSSALSYQTDNNGSAFIGELYGSYPIEQTTTPTDRNLSNLEVLLGYRWSAFKSFDLHGGFGTEAYHGLGSPDVRAYLGLNWRVDFLNGNSSDDVPVTKIQNHSNQQVLDSDNDGITDNVDQCPNTWSQNYVDDTGCTIESSKTTIKGDDKDNDGIPDTEDRCLNSRSGAKVNSYGCEIRAY